MNNDQLDRIDANIDFIQEVIGDWREDVIGDATLALYIAAAATDIMNEAMSVLKREAA